MKGIYISRDPRPILNLYFMEFARSGRLLFRHELYGRIKDAVLANSELEDVYKMIKNVVAAGIINGVGICCEVHASANWGSIRWRRYYRRGDCRNRNDVMLKRGVEDLLPPNKGLYVRPLIKFLQIEKMPRTTGELEELKRSLQEAGAPRCSNHATTQSALDWIWRGHIPIDTRPLASAEPRLAQIVRGGLIAP